MAKKFTYDKPLGHPRADTGQGATSMAIPPGGPQTPKMPEPQQAQGRIDLPKARRALKALSAPSQTYFDVPHGKDKK